MVNSLANIRLKENINVFDDDQEIKSLDTLNYKEISVSQSFESKKYYNNTSSIVVAEKKSDYIRYDVSSDDTGVRIFSEISYLSKIYQNAGL